jgi:hypothetical protein
MTSGLIWNLLMDGHRRREETQSICASVALLVELRRLGSFNLPI